MTLSHSDRIVITGGAGFLGSFLIEKLKASGHLYESYATGEEIEARNLADSRGAVFTIRLPVTPSV